MATPAQSRTLPDDVLTAILELARQESRKEQLSFRGHDDDLQSIFFELARDPKHDLLQEFVFSDSGPRPYSPTLSDSVSKLQLAGLVGRRNPDYEIVFTTPAARKFYDSVLSNRFSPTQIEQLRDIAKKFLSKTNLV